jgi:SNF2 family DNA or RNA helicase
LARTRKAGQTNISGKKLSTNEDPVAVLRLKDGVLIAKIPARLGKLAKSVPGYKWVRLSGLFVWPATAVIDVVDTIPFDEISVDAQELYREAKDKAQLLEFIKDKEEHDPGKTEDFLMSHQRKCVEIARHFKRFALFLDTGTGKTITALQIIRNSPHKFVVICPKSIIKTAWMEDHEDFFPDMRVLPLSLNIKRTFLLDLAGKWQEQGLIMQTKPKYTMGRSKLIEIMLPYADTVIINPESFKSWSKDLLDRGFEGLIIDESTTVKNPKAKRTILITEFADLMQSVYIMSGKPAPKNELDYYAQMRIVDASIFGTNYFKFRYQYFHQADYMGYKWEMTESRRDDFVRKLSRASIFIAKEECLDLPEKTYLMRSVEMPTKTFKHYKDMLRQRFADLESTMVTVQTKVASLMKLRQLTSGFIYKEDGEFEQVDTAKVKELMLLLEEIGDNQVIIWCQFKPEIRLIKEMLEKNGDTVSTAYGETKDTDQNIADFKEGKTQYMVAHPSTLKFGATFVKCTYAVYYSMSYNYEEYYQSHDRIYRKGQEKPCTFIFLIEEDTIDEDLYYVNQEKGDAAALIERLVTRVRGQRSSERGW